MAVRIHRSGMVVVAAVVLIGIDAMPEDPGAGLLLGILTVASLLLHECGHMLAARSLQVKVREVGICLKGSYIRREQARTPLDDFAISLSGPMVNSLIAAALWTIPGVCHWLAVFNLVLLVTNLAPLPAADGRRAWISLKRAAENWGRSVAGTRPASVRADTHRERRP